MKLLKDDLIITVIITALLLWDLSVDAHGFVDYFNYIYIIFIAIRVLVFCIQRKNIQEDGRGNSAATQRTTILRPLAQCIFFVLAVLDIFG